MKRKKMNGEKKRKEKGFAVCCIEKNYCTKKTDKKKEGRKERGKALLVNKLVFVVKVCMVHCLKQVNKLMTNLCP